MPGFTGDRCQTGETLLSFSYVLFSVYFIDTNTILRQSPKTTYYKNRAKEKQGFRAYIIVNKFYLGFLKKRLRLLCNVSHELERLFELVENNLLSLG